jgi:glycine cleavage system pyridoxal-binding protein P
LETTKNLLLDDFMERFNIQENMVRFMIMLILLKANENQIKVAVAADILSLVKLTPPGEMGVVVGTTQRFRNPMGYGGPHAAYFATKEIQRSMPGRIIGVSQDMMVIVHYVWHCKRGNNILKKKATSNICTASFTFCYGRNVRSLSERITIHRR